LKYSVLGLGYAPQEYDEERTEWMKHGIEYDFAESLEDAAEKLRRQTYVCIAIRIKQYSKFEDLVSSETMTKVFFFVARETLTTDLSQDEFNPCQ